MSQDLFKEENLVKSNFVRWEKIGQTVQGVYVEKKIMNNVLRPGTRQTIYILIQDDGSQINISGRGNQDPTIIPGLEAARFGEFLGLKFEGLKESSKPGMQPAKIIKVYNAHEVKEDVLNKYRGVDMEDLEAELPNM